MRVSIIVDDRTVYVDGAVAEVDLTWMGDDIHAVQWYGEYGEVEYRHTDTKHPSGNERINSFAQFERVVELHENALAAERDSIAKRNALLNVKSSSGLQEL